VTKTDRPLLPALRRIACAALAAGVVASCVVYEPQVQPMAMPWGERVNMRCMGDKAMAIDFIPAPRAARVTFDATTVTLQPVDAASDAKFTDGRYTLYINDNRAALEETGMVVRGPCTPR
jgi:membrane-bound inhibitor of C-type lysozyme